MENIILYLLYKTNTMNTNYKLREEWRALNLKITQIDKVIKMNNITDADYLIWVNELKKRRDFLTKLI
jgi:hypothetical protein